MQDLNRSEHDVLWGERSGSFNGEDEFGIVLTDHNRLSRQTYIARELRAFLTQRALTSVLDLDTLLEVVQFENLSRALSHQGLLLRQGQLAIDHIIV